MIYWHEIDIRKREFGRYLMNLLAGLKCAWESKRALPCWRRAWRSKCASFVLPRIPLRPEPSLVFRNPVANVVRVTDMNSISCPRFAIGTTLLRVRADGMGVRTSDGTFRMHDRLKPIPRIGLSRHVSQNRRLLGNAQVPYILRVSSCKLLPLAMVAYAQE